jgi:hypothetical protein
VVYATKVIGEHFPSAFAPTCQTLVLLDVSDLLLHHALGFC